MHVIIFVMRLLFVASWVIGGRFLMDSHVSMTERYQSVVLLSYKVDCVLIFKQFY